VISLPTLLSEGERRPFSFLLSHETLLRKMEEPKYSRVAKSFVNQDRTQAVFLIRMIEGRRDKDRLAGRGESLHGLLAARRSHC